MLQHMVSYGWWLGRRGARISWRALGVLLILVGIIFLILAGPFFSYAVEVAEKRLSPDHHITPQGIGILHRSVIGHGVLLACVGVAIVLGTGALSEGIPRVAAWYRSFIGRRFTCFLFWSSLVAGIVLIALWFLIGRLPFLYGEDRLFETLTAVLFLSSAFLLFVVVRPLHLRVAKGARTAVVLLMGIAAMLLLFGLEELSWGQRLFGWETPAILRHANDQGELNIHNLYNSLLPHFYQYGSAALGLVTVAGWFFVLAHKDHWLAFLVPVPATAGLLLLIILIAVTTWQWELLEELGATFSFFYAFTAARMIWGTKLTRTA
jgi:hypothetical protein